MAEIGGNKVTFDTSHIVLTAGSTSANETLMFCLAEAGDAFLLPVPYYPGYVYIFHFTSTFIGYLLLLLIYCQVTHSLYHINPFP